MWHNIAFHYFLCSWISCLILQGGENLGTYNYVTLRFTTTNSATKLNHERANHPWLLVRQIISHKYSIKSFPENFSLATFNIFFVFPRSSWFFWLIWSIGDRNILDFCKIKKKLGKNFPFAQKKSKRPSYHENC